MQTLAVDAVSDVDKTTRLGNVAVSIQKQLNSSFRHSEMFLKQIP